MIVRHGFVSNSSSSSFVVIGDSGNNVSITGITEYSDGGDTLDMSFVNDEEPYEFGWGPEKIRYDTDARIAWCMLQINGGYTDYDDIEHESVKSVTGGDPELRQMLEDVIYENSRLNLIWKLHPASYIDHQSVGYSNLDIFADKETLRRFIYDEESYIELDNDNH